MRGTSFAAVAILLLMGVGVAVLAGPIEDASTARSRGDFAVALDIYKQLAAKGDGEAQFNLGMMSLKGQGVDASLDEAIKWFKLAADNASSSDRTRADAAYNLNFIAQKLGTASQSGTASAAPARIIDQRQHDREWAEIRRREAEDLRWNNERREAAARREEARQRIRQRDEANAIAERARQDAAQTAATNAEAAQRATSRGSFSFR